MCLSRLSDYLCYDETGDQKRPENYFVAYTRHCGILAAACDWVFGNQLQLTSTHIWYYVLANNALASAFYPERAEYVLLQIVAESPAVMPGQLAINEFLAKNDNGVSNEYGEKADWIELINNTNETLVLSGLFMTDSPNNLQKWAFPANAAIPANGLLIIWADERADTPGNIHCNFKLSADGEHIYISRQDGTIIDNISFGPQAADVSTGRCPDGTGSYITFNPPSFNARNCTVGMDEKPDVQSWCTPNPATDFLWIKSPNGSKAEARLYDNLGRLACQTSFTAETTLNISNLPSGIYSLKVLDDDGHSQVAKVIIRR
ncbi:MAG TPA: lamin tail domain-containing protein [Bacteroidales bacterium]|nr:lamin tail domain-containing protein [Bacteroidales bacterium]